MFTDMNNPSEETIKLVGNQLGQAHLVTRCIVIALVQQPNFDAQTFLKTLRDEEKRLDERADMAKDVIKTIISEVEGYT